MHESFLISIPWSHPILLKTVSTWSGNGVGTPSLYNLSEEAGPWCKKQPISLTTLQEIMLHTTTVANNAAYIPRWPYEKTQTRPGSSLKVLGLFSQAAWDTLTTEKEYNLSISQHTQRECQSLSSMNEGKHFFYIPIL